MTETLEQLRVYPDLLVSRLVSVAKTPDVALGQLWSEFPERRQHFELVRLLRANVALADRYLSADEAGTLRDRLAARETELLDMRALQAKGGDGASLSDFIGGR